MTPLANCGENGGKTCSSTSNSNSKYLSHVFRGYNTLRVCSSSELSHRILSEGHEPGFTVSTTTNLDLLNPGYLPPPNRLVFLSVNVLVCEVRGHGFDSYRCISSESHWLIKREVVEFDFSTERLIDDGQGDA